jgi:hypothetical protein
MRIDVNVRVAGGAGQGVHTVSNLIARMAVAAGYHIHVTQDYMSRIRGGRNSQTVRIGSDPGRRRTSFWRSIPNTCRTFSPEWRRADSPSRISRPPTRP